MTPSDLQFIPNDLNIRNNGHKSGAKASGEKQRSVEEIFDSIANVGEQPNAHNGKDRIPKLVALPVQMMSLTAPLKPAALPVRQTASTWNAPVPPQDSGTDGAPAPLHAAKTSSEIAPSAVPATESASRPVPTPPPKPAKKPSKKEPKPTPKPAATQAQPAGPPPTKAASESAPTVNAEALINVNGQAKVQEPSRVRTPEDVWNEWIRGSSDEKVLCLEKVRLALRKKGYTARFIEVRVCMFSTRISHLTHFWIILVL